MFMSIGLTSSLLRVGRLLLGRVRGRLLGHDGGGGDVSLLKKNIWCTESENSFRVMWKMQGMQLFSHVRTLYKSEQVFFLPPPSLQPPYSAIGCILSRPAQQCHKNNRSIIIGQVPKDKSQKIVSLGNKPISACGRVTSVYRYAIKRI